MIGVQQKGFILKLRFEKTTHAASSLTFKQNIKLRKCPLLCCFHSLNINDFEPAFIQLKALKADELPRMSQRDCYQSTYKHYLDIGHPQDIQDLYFFWRLHTKTGQIDTKTYKTYIFLETSCQSRTNRVFCWFRVPTQDVLCFNFATPRENVNKHQLLVSLI